MKATEIMALEGARHGVRVNALAPGYILTDVSRVLLESERSETFVKGIPMRRYGEFDDLDGPLLLLASDASSYMPLFSVCAVSLSRRWAHSAPAYSGTPLLEGFKTKKNTM